MPRTPGTIRNLGQLRTSQAPQRADRFVTGALGRESTGDRAKDAMQSRASDATASARSLPFGDGNNIAGIGHSAGGLTTFNHLLGRAARGAFPINIIGSSTVKWVVTNLGTAAAPQIQCFTDQACTVDWWVY